MFRFLKRFFCVHEYEVIHEMETTRTMAESMTGESGRTYNLDEVCMSEEGFIEFLGKKKLVILTCKRCGKTFTERLD